MTRDELIRLFSPIIIFLVLTFLQCKINSKRINRGRQLVMPFISVIYSIAALVYAHQKFDSLMELYRIIRKYQQYIPIKIEMGVDVLIFNAAVAGVYVFGRMVPNLIALLASRNKVFFERVLSVFYVYDDNYGEWLLRDKWTNIRDLFRMFSLASAVVTGIITGFIWHKGFDSEFHAYVFPALAMIIITEIYVFLNGITEIEYAKTVSGDDSYAQKIRNFYKIREIYEKIFVHEILTSETGCDFRSRQSVTDLLEDLGKSEDETEQKIAEFYRLNDSPDHYDADYITASLKLLKGQNVLFFDPFYRDLDKYLILPTLYNLLSNRKVLIVTGRESVKEDIGEWITKMLSDYGKVESLWRVRELDFRDPECEIGILGSSSLYAPDVMKANESFFAGVGLVIMIEPSHIVNIGQIGLSILGRAMTVNGDRPVYCFMDRITDGLLDSLSHILQIEITEAMAPPISRNIHTAMAFNADGDYLREKLFEKQTGYLGDGIELAAVAIKNQIPKVAWYSESKSPIRDIKWLAGQYFSTICKYMNVPIQQESLYEHIDFISNIWSMSAQDYQFIIAEDEFRNIFNTMRIFLSRGREQTFVNVLSENYLLRDYMRCNTQMFMSNPDAIPSIVPDYAKTERNTLIKLLFEMSVGEVSESEIVREFNLVGVKNNDALSILTEYLQKYFGLDNSIFNIRVEKHDMSDYALDEENMYSILEETFNKQFRNNLKYAYFICEDEGRTEHIDAKLFGHITQAVLPGQFVVFDGKYYIVHDMSPENGVILRRSSNLYAGRKYYRQLREYKVAEWGESAILARRTVMDIEFTRLSLSYDVATAGYLEMNDNCDLRSARLVDLTLDPRIEDYSRSYQNKTALMIRLPETDVNIRFTISILLSELLKSVFPDAWDYIGVTCVIPEEVDGMLNHLTYDLSGCVDEDCIFIFEDSEMDLGLMEAIEKNMIRFLEIITDFLGWHFEKMREPAASDPVPVTPEFPEVDYKKRKKSTELFKRIRSLFGVKKEEEVSTMSVEAAEKRRPKPQQEEKPAGAQPVVMPSDAASEPGEEQKDYSYSLDITDDQATVTIETKETEQDASDGGFAKEDAPAGEETSGESGDFVKDETTGIAPDNSKAEFEVSENPNIDDSEGNPEVLAVDGTDIFDESGSPEDDEYLEEAFIERGIVSPVKSRYQRECFLKFGFDAIDGRLRIEDVHKYLTVRGYANNAYRKARTRDMFDDTLIDLDAVNQCDFCGIPISGVSYERLNDGRIRCNDCSTSAINSVEEFRKLFNQSISLMQSFFDIDFHVGMSITMVDAEKVAKGYGSVYKPSTQYAARVLGYAKKSGSRYELCIENGSPRLAAIETMIHELTHIWQYKNWDHKQIKKLYPHPDQIDMVYEGMAVWVATQYLYLIGENSYAQKQEIIQGMREDVYGQGFNMYRAKYPLIKDSSLIKYSPFTQFPPL